MVATGPAVRRVLIISHDVVGGRMAGPGIRYWEMGRFLSHAYDVTLVAPRPPDRVLDSVTVGSYQWNNPSSLGQWLTDADVVIANGYVLMGHPELAQIEQPLALDLYDPFLLENLEVMRAAPDGQRITQHRQDLVLWNHQLTAGDFFLCATERQRDLYIGALTTVGRITPHVTDRDPLLRGLINVAPFGLPEEPPHKQRPALRDVVPGIGTGDAIILWTGGLWDWLDPVTLVRAMPQVIAHNPGARLVFLAGQHPGDVPPMRVPEETKAAAAALGLLDRYVFFYEQWIRYEERADFLLEADIAVSLHHNHLETAYAAVRSRFLDHLWAGLPSIMSDGDAAADLVRAHELGIVVPAENVDAVASAITYMLDNPAARERYAGRAHNLASTWSWPNVLEPIRQWLASSPETMRAPLATGDVVPAGRHPHLGGFNEEVSHPPIERLVALIQELEQLWQLFPTRSPAGTLSTRIRRQASDVAHSLIEPTIQQQTDFNSLLLKILYWLSEEVHSARRHDEAFRQYVEEILSRIDNAVKEAHERIGDEEEISTLLAQHLSRVDPVRPQ